jgi:hypothetical protein
MHSPSFPSFSPFPAEVEALVSSGLLVDISYGNDTCPSFVRSKDMPRVQAEGCTENVPVLFVDHDSPEQREISAPQFMVQLISTGECVQTECLTPALLALFNR